MTIEITRSICIALTMFVCVGENLAAALDAAVIPEGVQKQVEQLAAAPASWKHPLRVVKVESHVSAGGKNVTREHEYHLSPVEKGLVRERVFSSSGQITSVATQISLMGFVSLASVAETSGVTMVDLINNLGAGKWWVYYEWRVPVTHNTSATSRLVRMEGEFSSLPKPELNSAWKVDISLESTFSMKTGLPLASADSKPQTIAVSLSRECKVAEAGEATTIHRQLRGRALSVTCAVQTAQGRNSEDWIFLEDSGYFILRSRMAGKSETRNTIKSVEYHQP